MEDLETDQQGRTELSKFQSCRARLGVMERTMIFHSGDLMQVHTLLFTSYVMLNKLHHFSEPHFS